MEILKFLHCVCILFCLYGWYTLVEDNHAIRFEKTNETEEFQYLACEELKNLFPNETKIDLKKLRGDLYRQFKISTFGNYWRKLQPEKFEELILNLKKSGGYLILNRRVCLIVNNEKELIEICNFLSLRTYFAIKSDTMNFVKMSSWADKIDQLTVLRMEPPTRIVTQATVVSSV